MYRILCIEDSSFIQFLLNKTLSSDYQVTIVSTLRKARAELEQNFFDLVLLDIGLPDGSGLSFCSEMKNDKKLALVPIFILSANHSDQEKASGFQLGIDDYILKPFKPLELRNRIELRLKKATDQECA